MRFFWQDVVTINMIISLFCFFCPANSPNNQRVVIRSWKKFMELSGEFFFSFFWFFFSRDFFFYFVCFFLVFFSLNLLFLMHFFLLWIFFSSHDFFSVVKIFLLIFLFLVIFFSQIVFKVVKQFLSWFCNFFSLLWISFSQFFISHKKKLSCDIFHKSRKHQL